MHRKFSNILCILLALGILLGGFLGWNLWRNSSFEETFYALRTDKLEGQVRAVVLTDLHQRSFGQGNSRLLHRIRMLKPDLILIAGDIVDRHDPDVDFVVELCGDLAEIAPVYYGFGNHENTVTYGSDLNEEFLQQYPALEPGTWVDLSLIQQDGSLIDGLRARGITVLQNEAATVELAGGTVRIGGVATDTATFWNYSGAFAWDFAGEPQDAYTILLCHRPEVAVQHVTDCAVDLTLSGHLHGGGVRIPGKGGLFSMEDGLFPDYDGGLYELGEMELIVSRGFAGYGILPRIFNQPELVIVDLN